MQGSGSFFLVRFVVHPYEDIQYQILSKKEKKLLISRMMYGPFGIVASDWTSNPETWIRFPATPNQFFVIYYIQVEVYFAFIQETPRMNTMQ